MTEIIWRNLIKSSECRKTVHRDQVGGCTGHNTNTLAFLEETKNDITQYSRKPWINFDNNAASCYDRIIPNIANLIGRKKGLHRKRERSHHIYTL
eukprot:7183414-Ditylum_brightwellii.AAC.1